MLTLSNFFKNKIIRIIENYGQTITFKETPESTITINSKAFIQPVKYEDFLNLNGYYSGSSNSYFVDDFYKYLGLPEIRLDEFPNAVISHENTSYSVKDAEKICLSNEIFYIKAIIQKIQN